METEPTQRLSPSGAPPPRTVNDLAGTTLDGYQLVRKIANGGMGVVYEAVQTKLDRKVALKILSEQLADRQEFLHRFEREAKAAAALNHPNIVQVHDFGEADGRHFIIMEYVDGRNLAAHAAIFGKLPVSQALDIIEQTAHALKAAAEKSIIHRDIKPSNLMLTRNGIVKVADLGLAKIVTQDSDLTMSNIVGSPHFIAPEQAADSRKADHRADIYSLGLTLFFLLTGEYPFDGESPISIVLAHTQKPLRSATEFGVQLPADVESLIDKMSAKDPQDRYQNYDELLADLKAIKEGQSPAAAQVQVATPVPAPAASLPPTPATISPGTPPTLTPLPASAVPSNWKVNLVVVIAAAAIVLAFAAVGSALFVLAKRPAQKVTTIIVTNVEPVAVAAAPHVRHPRQELENSQLPDDQQPAAQNLRGEKPPFRFPMPMGLPPQTPPGFIAQSAVTDTLNQYETKMREAIAKNDWQGAYDVWTNFPSNMRSRETDLRIMNLLQQSLPQDFRPRASATAMQGDRFQPPD